MKGTMVILSVNGSELQVPIHGALPFEKLKDALNGGLLETVPFLESITINGEKHSCIAFCDEEGKLKNLPVNLLGNFYWDAALKERGLTLKQMQDILVGPIVVLYGDDEFMRTL